MQNVDQYPWYHGKLDRQRAEDILRNKKTGTYLVRDSNTIPGDYVLSVRENASLGALYSHYIINCRAHLYIIGDQTFNSLPEVINFYYDHYLDTTVLTEIADLQPSSVATVQKRPQPGKPMPPPVNVTVPGVPATSAESSAANMQGVCTVKALFKFESNDPEDLEFEKDDVMVILSKDEEAWWTARHTVNGRQGSIPVPYVEVLNTTPKQTPSEEPQRHREPQSAPDGGAASPQPSAPNSGGRQGNRPVRALAILDRYASAYDSTALSFKAGETITVRRQNENGLWEGELNGKQGHFPFTHVQVIDDGDASSFNY